MLKSQLPDCSENQNALAAANQVLSRDPKWDAILLLPVSNDPAEVSYSLLSDAKK